MEAPKFKLTTYQRITIIRAPVPRKKNINEELRWLGHSLGLFNLRDKDQSLFRVFIELLKSAKQKQPVTSDELAERLNLSRGTVIHHINKLIESGLALNHKNRYTLRVDTLEVLIDEVRKDLDRVCHDLKDVAKNIDSFLGL